MCAIVVVVILAAPAIAAPADVANSVASKIMSPYCPGVTLHDCPSDNATELIARIEGLAADGYTEAQIIDLMVAEFGPGIKATPPIGGDGFAVWAIPLLAAIVGGGLAWLLLRRWTRPKATPDGYDREVHVTTEDRKRLERELRLFKEGA